MRRIRHVSVLVGALVMVGLAARTAVALDSDRGRRGGSDAGARLQRGGSDGRQADTWRRGADDRDKRHRRLLHVKGLSIHRQGMGLWDRRRLRRQTRVRAQTRTVYRLSVGYRWPSSSVYLSYGSPYYDGYSYRSYGYLTRPTREKDVYVYVLPGKEPVREKEYERLEPKTQDEPKETLFPSDLSPKLGGSDKVSAEFALAEEALKVGMLGLAIQDFREIALAKPDDPVPKLALGLALFARGDLGDAAAALRSALAVHPDPEGIELDKQLVFRGQEAYELRVKEVVAGLEEDPENADLHLLMGLHYFSRGDFAEAAVHLQKAEALDPADAASARLRALSMAHVSEEGEAAPDQVEPAPDATAE